VDYSEPWGYFEQLGQKVGVGHVIQSLGKGWEGGRGLENGMGLNLVEWGKKGWYDVCCGEEEEGVRD
jgi:hypothetical protein